MGAAILVCRLVLASVFVVAGLTKLADLAGSRRAAADFGVPRRLAPAVGSALPAIELTVALALLPSATSRVAAIAALILLTGFSVAIADANLRGRAPDCHCFGQLRSAPARWTALARNLALLALAGFVAVRGWSALVIPAGVILILLALRGARRPTPADAAAVGLRVGAPAPEFELRALDGRDHSLRTLLSPARPLVLVFTDARCVPCDALMPRLAEMQRRVAPSALGIAVIAGGDPAQNAAKANQYGLARVLLDPPREVAEAYGALGTPMAVLVSADGLIARRAVASGEAIAAMISDAAGPAPAPDVGDPVPAVALRDLDRVPVSLAELAAAPTVVLFWSPSCEFCQKMLPGLRALEQELSAGGPRLVVISDGEPAEIRAQELRSTVLLDPERSAMARFGASGTPMALLVADGRIASPLAAGAAGLVELLDAIFARG